MSTTSLPIRPPDRCAASEGVLHMRSKIPSRYSKMIDSPENAPMVMAIWRQSPLTYSAYERPCVKCCAMFTEATKSGPNNTMYTSG